MRSSLHSLADITDSSKDHKENSTKRLLQDERAVQDLDRYPRYTCSSDFTFPLAVGAYGSLQLLIQPWICAPGTHYGWVDRGSVEYEVCPTLLHMASTGNRTPDLLILSPTPYPLGHVLPILTIATSHLSRIYNLAYEVDKPILFYGSFISRVA